MKTKITLFAVMLAMHSVCAGMNYSSSNTSAELQLAPILDHVVNDAESANTSAELQLDPILDHVVNDAESALLFESFLDSLPKDGRPSVRTKSHWGSLIRCTADKAMKCSLGELLMAKFYFEFLSQQWRNTHLSLREKDFVANVILTAVASVMLSHKSLNDNCYSWGLICEYNKVDLKNAINCELKVFLELLHNNKLVPPVKYYNSEAMRYKELVARMIR